MQTDMPDMPGHTETLKNIPFMYDMNIIIPTSYFDFQL